MTDGANNPFGYRGPMPGRAPAERSTFWRSMLEIAESNLVDAPGGAPLSRAGRRRA